MSTTGEKVRGENARGQILTGAEGTGAQHWERSRKGKEGIDGGGEGSRRWRAAGRAGPILGGGKVELLRLPGEAVDIVG